MDLNRRKFIKDASLVSAGVVAGISGVSAASNAIVHKVTEELLVLTTVSTWEL